MGFLDKLGMTKGMPTSALLLRASLALLCEGVSAMDFEFDLDIVL